MYVPKLEEYNELVKKTFEDKWRDEKKSQARLKEEKVFDDIVKCLELMTNEQPLSIINILQANISKLKSDLEDYKNEV